jgi:hypothetical protein
MSFHRTRGFLALATVLVGCGTRASAPARFSADELLGCIDRPPITRSLIGEDDAPGRRLPIPRDWLGLWRALVPEDHGPPRVAELASIFVTERGVVVRYGDDVTDYPRASLPPNCLASITSDGLLETQARMLFPNVIEFGDCVRSEELTLEREGVLVDADGGNRRYYVHIPFEQATVVEAGLVRCERGGVSGRPAWLGPSQ